MAVKLLGRSQVFRHSGPYRLVQVLFVVSVSGCRRFQSRHRTEAGALHSECIPIHPLAGSCRIVHRHCGGHRTAGGDFRDHCNHRCVSRGARFFALVVCIYDVQWQHDRGLRHGGSEQRMVLIQPSFTCPHGLHRTSTTGFSWGRRRIGFSTAFLAHSRFERL